MPIPSIPPRARTSPRYLQNLARPNLISGVRAPMTDSWQATSNGYTLMSAWALEGPFDLVRLVYGSDYTAGYTVAAACIAPSALYNDGINPKTSGNANVAWKGVTFNNAGADIEFAAQPAGATATVAVPAGAAAGAIGIALSDWMPVSSLDRADAGASLPLLFTRTYSGPSSPLRYPITFVQSQWAAVDRGRIITTAYIGGDKASAPAVIASGWGISNFLTPIGIQTYRRGRGHTVLVIGDSLNQGVTTESSFNNYGNVACAAISTLARPVCSVNAGWTGQTSAIYAARAYKEIDLWRPTSIIIETSTPNDAGANQAVYDLGFARALSVARYAESRGIVPILKTAVPWFNYTAVGDGFRRVINDRVRAIGASGEMLILDADAVVTDGGSPARLLPGYLGSDNMHMNTAAHAAIGAVLAPILSKALGV